MTKSLIYFVPGIKGSVLYDKRVGRNIWPPEKIINSWNVLVRKRSYFDSEILRLKLPLDITDDVDDPNVIATDIVKCVNIGPISGFMRRPVYEYIIRIIRSHASDDDTIVEFAYDWRRSIYYCARKLYESINSRYRNDSKKYDKILIISHSYGGLVSRYMMESDKIIDDPNLIIDYALNIGTPHYGSMKSIRYLTGLTSISICSDAALLELCQSFDSMYDTIPLNMVNNKQHVTVDKAKLSKARERRKSMEMFRNIKHCRVSININIINILRMYKESGNICSGDGVVDVKCEKINNNNTDGIEQCMKDLERDSEHINIMNKKYIKNVIEYVMKTNSNKYDVENMLDNNKKTNDNIK